jgi:hypothetical protein
MEKTMTMKSYITPGHVRAYQMLTSPHLQENFTLTSCLINGEPGVAIVIVDRISEEKVSVLPLFVGITAKMNLEFDGEEFGSGESEEGGGGPREADPDTLRMFAANKASLDPTG